MKNAVNFLILILLCFACTPDAKEMISHAESVWQEYPDSALSILTRIDFPDKLADKEKADYGWITASAHYSSHKSLSTDSLILFALNYYKSKNDSLKLLSSYQLSVLYYALKNDFKSASLLNEEGLSLAKQLNDSIAIAELYFIKSEIESEKEAIKSYHQIKAYDNRFEAAMEYRIALAYGRTGPRDSAIHYFEKSTKTALLKNDREGPHYWRNYGDFLYAIGDKKGALGAMLSAIRYYPEYANSNLYSTIALIYTEEHQIDSAQYFLNQAKKIYQERADKDSPNYLTTNNTILAIQAVIDYAKGGHIDNHQLGRYNDSIAKVITKKQIESQAELKTINLLEHNALQLKIRHRNTQLLMSMLISSFLIVAGVFYIYLRRKKQKLQEAEEKNEALQRLLQDATKSDAEKDNTTNFFKKILLQQLGLIRLVASIPTSQNQELLQQMAQISNDEIPVDSLLVWEDLYPIIDSVYDNFYSNMYSTFKNTLSDKEMQLCCLLCAEFTTKEISVVTQQSVRTIYQRKTTIRQKLQMDEKEDIVSNIRFHSTKKMAN